MLLSTPRRWCAGGAGPPAVAGAGRRALAPPPRAQQQSSPTAAAAHATPKQPREHLRVLRYPNGDERVIRYPAYVAEDAGGARPSASAASAASATTTTASTTTTKTTTTARAAPAAGSGDSGSSSGSGMGGGVASASLDDYLSWDVTGLWSSSSARPEAPSGGGGSGVEQRDGEEQQQQQEREKDEDEEATTSSSSSSAADRRRRKQQQSDADYLESLFAAAYAQRPAMPPKGTSSRPTTQAAPVSSDGTADSSPSPLPAGTYQVLTGCPWPVPRPLYTLALRHSASAAAAALASRLHPPQEEDDGNAAGSASPDEDRVGSTYTLSVRTRDHGAADDLARALGKGRDWAARMDVGSRRDGVVAFASERDARRFAALLELPADGQQPGGGHSGVAVARVDSHALFRAADDVKSVVVYLPPCTKGGMEGAAAAAGGGEGAGEATTSASDDDGAGDGAAAGGRVPRPHELAAALLRE